MRLLLLLTYLLLMFSACKQKQSYSEKKKEINSGKLNENNIYTAKEVGWTVKIPEGWQVITKQEQNKINERGKEAIEKSSGVDVNVTDLVSLINFKKDMFNSFLSNMQPFDEKEYGSYDKQNYAMHQLIKDMYASKDIQADYELAATRIGGVMLDRFITKVYSPDRKKVILNQEMFSALINGYVFSMTINYNNEKDKEILMEAVNSSTFSNVKAQ